MNWGKGITIFLIAFIGFITTLAVILMRADADLVSKDYYIEEVAYGNEITAQKNAQSTSAKLSKEITVDGVMLTLSSTEVEEGFVELRRSNDPTMDINLTLKGKNIFIDQKHLNSGKYDVVIDWKHSEKSYQLRDVIWIP